MDNSDKKTTRKTHDINTQIEEDNLWDLEDDWEGDDPVEEIPPSDHITEPDTEPDSTEEDSPVTIDSVEDNTEDEAGEEPDESAEKTATPPTEEEEQGDGIGDDAEEEDEFELDDQEEFDLESPKEDELEKDELEDDESADTPEEDTITGDHSESSDTDIEPVSEAIPEKSTNEIKALVSPLKKLSLSSAEKITLTALAVLFVGLAIYGYVWLYGKNTVADTETTLNLPVEGQYATISEFSSHWITPNNSAGVKLGAKVVPAASISLGEATTSGALRIYFRNAEKTSVGDPITVNFKDGKFNNGSNTIEVSASDGFHMEGDFHAYQMDSTLEWKVHVLEAESSAASGSSFKELFNTRVAPKRQ